MKSIKWLSVILSMILVLVLSGCHDGGETGTNADTSEFINKNAKLAYLQTSRSITLRNIDSMSIHDTNPTEIIQINQFGVQKCQMDFAGELKQGFNFVITYTLPETNYSLMKNHKITLKVEYPIEYFAVLGTSGSGISEIPKLTNYKPQTASLSFAAFPSNISEEDLEALLSKQYTFKVRSYIDDVLVKECDIQNTIQNI